MADAGEEGAASPTNPRPIDRSATVKELQARLLESTRQTKEEWQARTQAESRLQALEARMAGLGYQLEQERQTSQGLRAQLEELQAEKAILTEELQAAEQLSAFHAERAQQQLEVMRERLQAAEDQLSAQHAAREQPGARGRSVQVAELVQQHTWKSEGMEEQLELLRDKLQDYRAENFDLANQLALEKGSATSLRATLTEAQRKLSQLLPSLTAFASTATQGAPGKDGQPASPPAAATAATPAKTSASAALSSPLEKDLQEVVQQLQLALQSTHTTAQGGASPPSAAASAAEAAAGAPAGVPTPPTPAAPLSTTPAASIAGAAGCDPTPAATSAGASTPTSSAATANRTPTGASTTATLATSPPAASGQLGGSPALSSIAGSGTLEQRVAAALQVLGRLWSKYGDNPWHRGIVRGVAEAVQVLAGSGAQDAGGRTALHVAAARGQADVLAVLLQGGAQVDAVDTTGRTALHSGAEKGHVDVVKALVQAGAGLAATTGAGETALHCAASYGQERVVSELLAAGMDPWAGDGSGCTPLQKALFWGYAAVVGVLLQAMVKGRREAQQAVVSVGELGMSELLPVQQLLEEQVQALLTQLQQEGRGEANKVDVERVLAVQAQVQAALHERASPLIARCNEEALIAVLSPALGFHRGRPLAAVLLFRSCVHWSTFQSESTTFFQRALYHISRQLDESQHTTTSSPTEAAAASSPGAVAGTGPSGSAGARRGPGPAGTGDSGAGSGGSGAVSGGSVHHDNVAAYWLCNTATLLLVLNVTLKPVGASGGGGVKGGAGKPGAALLAALRSHLNTLRDVPSHFHLPGNFQLPRGPWAGRAQQETGQAGNVQAADAMSISAHLPALVFKRQLEVLVSKTFCTLRDNAMVHLSACISACTHRHDRNSLPGATPRDGPSTTPPAGWAQVVSVLGELLRTADSNCLPPSLVGELFHQLLVFLDANLFNQLLLRRECCSFSNARYLAEGIAQVDSWLASVGREVLGSATEDLQHIRQAVHFLMLSSKHKHSLRHISTDVCPALTLNQIYVLCTKFFDDEHGSGGVSPQVLSDMQAHLGSSGQPEGSGFLLDDHATAAPVVASLLHDMPPQDLLSSVPIPENLAKSTVSGAFQFLTHDLTLNSAS